MSDIDTSQFDALIKQLIKNSSGDASTSSSTSSAIYVLAASVFSLFVAFLKHHYGIRLRSACCTKECDIEMSGSESKGGENNKHEQLS